MCLRPATICKFHVRKVKGDTVKYTITARGITCPNFAKFSWTVAANSASSSPCSNAPLRCPICPEDSPAVWRYNMRVHFENSHPTNLTNPQYQRLWTLTDFEIEKMGNLWDNRHRKKSTRKKNTADVPRLVISEAHSARATLKFVLDSCSTLFVMLTETISNVSELNADEPAEQEDEYGMGATESINNDEEDEEDNREGTARIGGRTDDKESVDEMDEEIAGTEDQNSHGDEERLDEREHGGIDDIRHQVHDALQGGDFAFSAISGERTAEGRGSGGGEEMGIDVAQVREDADSEPNVSLSYYSNLPSANSQ